MKRVLIAAVILLVASSSAHAKLGVNLTLKVVGTKQADEKTWASELKEGIEARINSTNRYNVTTSAAGSDFFLGVNCLVLSNRSEPGTVCYTEVSYFPYRLDAVEITVQKAETMVIAGTSAEIVEYLINHFINGTTDVILAERKTFLRSAIGNFRVRNPSECKVPARE